MCGIAGIVGIDSESVGAEKIKLMNQCLQHRGPDAEGIYVRRKIALGHRRLSIIDLSESSNQPMTDPTGRYVITYNGEIYNFREIRDELKDYPFQTNSDTEVILAGYQRYGVDLLGKLNGMFAFAIWDNERERLFFARDRLGVKPFYYYLNETGHFVFASEIRALLQTGLIPKEISQQGLHDYLMFQSVYTPNTIVRDVFQLNAGEYGIFERSELKTLSYWNIELTPEKTFADISQTLSDIKRLLLESVERRMISDVPLGAFLSGGIDSSAIVGLMSEISSRPINTFSVTFDEKEFDESAYANIIAAKFNTRHTAIRLSAADFLAELPNALRSNDSPSGDGLNTYVVSKATKNAGITVALSGVGGDELFAGYGYFTDWIKLKQGFLPKTPLFLRKIPGQMLSSSNNSKYQRLAGIFASRDFNISEMYPIFRQVLSPFKVRQLMLRNGFESEIHKNLSAKLSAIEKFPLLSQFSIGELLGYTQNVLLKDTDQFSMASALEVREPFFDYKLVEYVLQIPDKYKYPTYPKSLLVEAISPLLPDQIVHRKKMGFVLPWESWMRNELRDFCQTRINVLAQRGLLSSDRLLRQWQDFLEQKNGVRWSHLWHLVVLTEWLENNNF